MRPDRVHSEFLSVWMKGKGKFRTHPLRPRSCRRRRPKRCLHQFVSHPAKEKGIGLGDVLGGVTMQLFVRDPFPMIAAPVQCDVDGMTKRSHHARLHPTASPSQSREPAIPAQRAPPRPPRLGVGLAEAATKKSPLPLLHRRPRALAPRQGRSGTRDDPAQARQASSCLSEERHYPRVPSLHEPQR
jgi:hypothetical protein